MALIGIKDLFALMREQLQPEDVAGLKFIWSDYLKGKFDGTFSLLTFQPT